MNTALKQNADIRLHSQLVRSVSQPLDPLLVEGGLVWNNFFVRG